MLNEPDTAAEADTEQVKAAYELVCTRIKRACDYALWRSKSLMTHDKQHFVETALDNAEYVYANGGPEEMLDSMIATAELFEILAPALDMLKIQRTIHDSDTDALESMQRSATRLKSILEAANASRGN